MIWEKVENVQVDPSARYLVKTNGAEWRDSDLFVMVGHLIIFRLAKSYVRGRPIWVALITNPEGETNDC